MYIHDYRWETKAVKFNDSLKISGKTGLMSLYVLTQHTVGLNALKIIYL